MCIFFKLRDTRKDIYDNEEANMDWQEEMFELNDDDTSSTTNELTDNTVYFVIDTNVVIRNISLVRRLITVPDLKGRKNCTQVNLQHKCKS